MIVDYAKINTKAGKGGDGLVSFRREKFVPQGGPDGGDGGNGGDVIFIADEHTGDLSGFNRQKNFMAENGQNGKTKKMAGKRGQDLILHLPLGTQIFFNDELIFDIVIKNQEFKIARGGQGGWGNCHFTSSIKQAPQWSKKGLAGESKALRLELKTIADIGLIGLPNAGKSTLLSTITNARPKIAAYPFTTLEPNLGAIKMKDKTTIIADIPGLIKGAWQGKGLGDKFLKHIERTKTLVHLIDATSDDIVKDYKTIRTELNKFSPKLSRKKEIVVISKIDAISDSDLKEKLKELKKAKIKASTISAVTNKNVDGLVKMMLQN